MGIADQIFQAAANYLFPIQKIQTNSMIYRNKEGMVNDTISAGAKILYGQTQKPFLIGNNWGLAEKLNTFTSFLIVFPNFKYSCVYICHIIYPEKPIWILIRSQTNIFNIIFGSVQQLNVMKIILANWIRETVGYLPQNSLWLYRLFLNLANKN